MQLDPAFRPGQPGLHQFRVVVSGIIQEEDVDKAYARIPGLNRHQQHDGADGVHRLDVVHDGLAGLEINRAVDVQTVPPLLCSIATGTSFGAQQPTGRTAWVGCTASAKTTASSASSPFIRASYSLMKAACFAGSSLREMSFGLRCSMSRRCSSAINPERVWYSMPHSCSIQAPTSRVVRGRVAAIQAFSLPCFSAVSRQTPPSLWRFVAASRERPETPTWPKFARPSIPSS